MDLFFFYDIGDIDGNNVRMIMRVVRVWIVKLLYKLGIFIPLNEDQPQWSEVCDLLRTWTAYTQVARPAIQWCITVLQFFNPRSIRLGRFLDDSLREMDSPSPSFFSNLRVDFLQLGFTNETVDELVAFLKTCRDIVNGNPVLLVEFLENLGEELGVENVSVFVFFSLLFLLISSLFVRFMMFLLVISKEKLQLLRL
jgi:hypothetical protein